MANIYNTQLNDAQEAYLKEVGFPTFDEFLKNPEKLRKRDDHVLDLVERGPQLLRNAAGVDTFYVGMSKMESIEQCERVIKELGWDISKIDFKVELEKGSAGKFDQKITFFMRGVDE